jgi:hypothetical protein
MDYSIKEYALIRFSMEGQTFTETLALDSETALPDKLKALSDSYSVTEFTVHRKFVLTPQGSEEVQPPLGVVVDSE